jgi:hypothetical protein
MEESLCTFLSCLVAPQMATVKLKAWDKAPAWPMAWVGLTDVALDCFRAAIELYFFKASFA